MIVDKQKTVVVQSIVLPRKIVLGTFTIDQWPAKYAKRTPPKNTFVFCFQAEVWEKILSLKGGMHSECLKLKF